MSQRVEQNSTLDGDFKPLLEQSEIWASFIENQVKTLEFELDSERGLLDTAVSFAHEASVSSDEQDKEKKKRVLERIGNMSLANVQFKKTEEADGVRSTNTYDAYVPGSPHKVSIVDYSLRTTGPTLHDFLLEEQKKPTNKSRTLKDALNGIAQTIDHDVFVAGLHTSLVSNLPSDYTTFPDWQDYHIAARQKNRPQELLKSLFDVIVSPFVYQTAYQYHKVAGGDSKLVGKECCNAFQKWFERHKDFFTSLWNILLHVEAYQGQIDNLDEKDPNREQLEKQQEFLQVKFNLQQQYFFKRFFSDPNHYQQGLSSEFETPFFFKHDRLGFSNKSEIPFKVIVDNELTYLSDMYETQWETARIIRKSIGNIAEAKSAVNFTEDPMVNEKIQKLHESLFPMLQKASKLYNERAYKESFALLTVFEKLTFELRQLAQDLSKSNTVANDEKQDETAINTQKQNLIDQFCRNSQKIFEDASHNNSLTSHRAWLSRLFDKFLHLFNRHFSTGRDKAVEAARDKVSSQFSRFQGMFNVSETSVDAKSEEKAEPPHNPLPLV